MALRSLIVDESCQILKADAESASDICPSVKIPKSRHSVDAIGRTTTESVMRKPGEPGLYLWSIGTCDNFVAAPGRGKL